LRLSAVGPRDRITLGCQRHRHYSPWLLRWPDGELVDGHVFGLVDRKGNDTGDPIRRDTELVIHALHLIQRCLVGEGGQQLGIDRRRIDSRGTDIGALHGGFHAQDFHEIAHEPLGSAINRAARICFETRNR